MIKIIVPQGMFGAVSDEPEIDSLIRKIAVAYSQNHDQEWAEKYGTDFENDAFMMHPYCWCEKDSCLWCNGDEPNFRHKATGFEVHWYKYIGREMIYNKTPPMDELRGLSDKMEIT